MVAEGVTDVSGDAGVGDEVEEEQMLEALE